MLRRLINFHRFVKRVGTLGAAGAFSGKNGGVNFNSIRLAMEKLSVKVKAAYELGLDLSPEERGRMLFKMLGVKFSESEKDLIYRQAGRILSNSGYYSKYPHLNPEARPALKALRSRFPDIKIGLVSNAARSEKTYRRMLEALGVARYFDAFTISCEVGFLKPRREIFEAALKRLSAKPSETIHVGDLFRADVVGAVDAGINAALYTGLWHRYAPYMEAGEHIPRNFNSRKGLIVKEVSKLGEIVDLVDKSRGMK